MVAWTGVEPVTLGLEVPCSIQLSYQAMSFKTYVFDSENPDKYSKFSEVCQSVFLLRFICWDRDLLLVR